MDVPTTKTSELGEEAIFFNGVCAYCKDDIVRIDYIAWEGRRYHPGCLFKVMDRVNPRV
jgi:hypothetical protein